MSTTADNSNALTVNAVGNADVTCGNLTTTGDNSLGGLITATGTINGSVGDISTSGDTSTGLQLSSTDAITFATGDVTTLGLAATGVNVTGGAGAIDLTTGDVSTSGDFAVGVSVTGTGTIGVTTGDVSTAGLGSNGRAAATGAPSSSGWSAAGCHGNVPSTGAVIGRRRVDGGGACPDRPTPPRVPAGRVAGCRRAATGIRLSRR